MDNITDWNRFLANAKINFNMNWSNKQNSNMTIYDFHLIRTIGTGTYGRVVLAKMKREDRYYAVKILDKGLILKMKQLRHTLNEKRVLQSTKFPFLISLEHFFKDDIYLYFVLPFVGGGEMYTHLRSEGKFSEHRSRFYAAQLVLTLEYLHSLKVIYRDLKPENVLFDLSGYIKLTDLGFCKVVEGKTYSICGTPEYLAPEIIASKGYSLAADWWSLGILLYEMCGGVPPFYAFNPMDIYDQIVHGSYRMMPTFSEGLKDLLSNLLQKDPRLRYGNRMDGVEDIKRHPWFGGLSWMGILNRSVQPPFVPIVRDAEDTKYFDVYDELPLKTSSIEGYSQEFIDF